VSTERLLRSLRHELLRAGPVSPALIEHEARRAANLQSRIADAVTAFAGSMLFVYVHIVWFTIWIALPVEKYPFGLLTMIVSLEAIFLSTFVMISQNRADEKREALGNQAWQMVQEEDGQNKELLELSRQILQLTQQLHHRAPAARADDRAHSSQ
jgi:uncharacterized membrane protein